MDNIEIKKNIEQGLYILSLTIKSEYNIISSPLYQWIERLNGYENTIGFWDPIKIILLDQNINKFNGCVLKANIENNINTPIYIKSKDLDELFIGLNFKTKKWLADYKIEIINYKLDFIKNYKYQFIINKLSLCDLDLFTLDFNNINKIVTFTIPTENANYISNTLSSTFPISSYILSSAYNYFKEDPIMPDYNIQLLLTKIIKNNNFDLDAINIIDCNINIVKSHNFIKDIYGELDLKKYNIYIILLDEKAF